jgi:hypothetical protein
VLLLSLVLMLVRELSRSPTIGAWRSDVGGLLASCGAFLAVEALFQFPFELPFPVLLAAVLVGLAFAATEARLGNGGEDPRPTAWPKTAAAVLFAAAILVGVLRLAVAETLSATRRDEPAALERACALDPRRLEACVEAAWLRSRAGDHAAARRLLESVLARSAYYLPALKLLSEDLLAAGEWHEGCRQARAYATLLGGASSMPDAALETCRTLDARSGR